jgi:16S rRNA (cytosine967-C5)-methyltransferase
MSPRSSTDIRRRYASARQLPRHRNARAVAAELLRQVAFDHRSLDRVLSDAAIAEPDRALVHEIVYGSVRHFYSLSHEVQSRLHQPLKPRDAIVFCLLIVGVYQLRHSRVPDYAVVNETVTAADQVGRSWARGLVNQLLRRAASEGAATPRNEEQAFDHPAWLISQMKGDYPAAWTAILETSLGRAPLSLRVNLAAISRETYLQRLASIGVTARLANVDEGLVLADPLPAAQIPGYTDGLASVQDLHAMWPARLLDATARQRVLDACAAPGGKSMHLLERRPDIDLTSLDIDEARCDTLRAEYRRCCADRPPSVVCGDATRLDWWDRRPFDAILLDAPCSGTGTLRRHPDIKLLKRESDIAQYQRLQIDLLTNLWRTLASGGRLLYCTCSVLSAENDGVVGEFLRRHERAFVQPLAILGAIETKYGRQLLPEPGGGDGFYFALLMKRDVEARQ